MFIAALLITVKSWKQPRCPLKGKNGNNVILLNANKE